MPRRAAFKRRRVKLAILTGNLPVGLAWYSIPAMESAGRAHRTMGSSERAYPFLQAGSHHRGLLHCALHPHLHGLSTTEFGHQAHFVPPLFFPFFLLLITSLLSGGCWQLLATSSILYFSLHYCRSFYGSCLRDAPYQQPHFHYFHYFITCFRGCLGDLAA